MRQLVQLQEMMPQFEQANIDVVALTTDTPDKNLRIANRLGLTMPILYDQDGKLLKALNGWDDSWGVALKGYVLLGPDLNEVDRVKGYFTPNDALLQRLAAKTKAAAGSS